MYKHIFIWFLVLGPEQIGVAQQTPASSPGANPSPNYPMPVGPTPAPMETVAPSSSSASNGSVPPNTVRDLVNGLDQRGLQEIIDRLRSTYVDSRALSTQEINQAAVEGLLARLGPGAMLQTKVQAEQPAPIRPFKSDLIESQFGYIRLGSINESGLSQLDETLGSFRDHGAVGLILDLRTMPPGSDFPLAAQIVSRFVPKDKVLFNLVEPKSGASEAFSSSGDPLFSGPVAVLVSQDNAGTAEAVASVLRNQLHALVIGQQTTGRAVEFARYDIGDKLVLTIAVKELVIPGAPSIFPNGLVPDIKVTFPKQQQDAVLMLSDQSGVTNYIFDEERPHTNEAALVAGKNPDLDAYEADHSSGKPKAQHLKDLVLQRGLDFLTAVNVLGAK
jgi:Peptidase family S41